MPYEKVEPIDILYLKTIYFITFNSFSYFPYMMLSISITVYWDDKFIFVYYLE